MGMDYTYNPLLSYILKRTQRDAWLKPSEEDISAGTCIQVESGSWVGQEKDTESIAPKTRRMRLIVPFYNGLGCALAIFSVGSGISVLLRESLLDGQWSRFALLIMAPFTFCISIFFFCQIIINLGMVIGPVSQYYENSRYYSAKKPEPNKTVDSNLPHVTIEMPVYKESLEKTIAPSIFHIEKAMHTYASQGGTSAIFVHDDGLQLLPERDREARIAFYADHNIGWVARPPHDVSSGGFKRAGQFKKASNMNYGLTISMKLEKHLKVLRDAAERRELDIMDDTPLEDRALYMACDEVFAESGGRWEPWACNGRSIRIGEIILLVDADTVVPEDCLRDAAREMAENPEVAIIQHASEIMQIAHHCFEDCSAYYTRRINKYISYTCAIGEVPPFLGHNAFLRWSALQDAAIVDPADGKRKIWSESNVSEDFDMSLRLQLKQYITRWATYPEGEFKEGVSLTAEDELSRWQKYSYGSSELIFNPLIKWLSLGPINKRLHAFVWSNVPIHYKLSIMSYMFSFYGVAASTVLSILNYLILGFGIQADDYYHNSYGAFLVTLTVFPGIGNLGYIMLEYRLGHRSLLDSFLTTGRWIPFLFVFYGGLSIHLTVVLLAHLFSYNITWAATKKEVEHSNFFIEVPRILKRYWLAFAISFTCFGAMIALRLRVAAGLENAETYWAASLPVAVASACHVLFPIILNPWLTTFSFDPKSTSSVCYQDPLFLRCWRYMEYYYHRSLGRSYSALVQDDEEGQELSSIQDSTVI